MNSPSGPNQKTALVATALLLCAWASWLTSRRAPPPREPQSTEAPAEKITVTPRAPKLEVDQTEWTAYEAGVGVAGRVLSALDATEFEVEYVNVAEPGHPKSVIRSHPEFTTELLGPGEYALRARVRLGGGEASAWSAITTVRVRHHTRPTKPQVFGVPERAFVGQVAPVNSESKTVKVRIQVADDEGHVIYVGHSKEDVFVPPKPGRYTVTAVAVNKDGQESLPSAAVTFEAHDIPKAIVEPNGIADPLRGLIARAPAPLKPNEKFRGDLLSIEGLLWRMQSSQQYYQNTQRPTSVGVGLRGIHWFGVNGIEGILRTDLFGLNQAGGESAITNIEIHYHRRWFMASPFTYARQMQMTVYAGVERFRNQRSLLYSTGYDLIKVGATAAVPFSSRWSVSGEGGLGLDGHGSRKFELQGLLTYYYSREWSFGIGYRTNLFEARTASQAPGGFYPYREGYTEFRSVFNYQF